MLTPPIPSNEAQRLKTLGSTCILDTPAEERFDRITRLAKRLFGVEIVLVSLVDECRQWFKSKQGLEATETPREISFCGHAILSDELFIVEDAELDPRFHDNPLVTGDPEISFYAGCPISAPNGDKLGTLCLIDPLPRKLSDEEIGLLKDLGQMVEDEFKAIALATIDELTGLSNRRGFIALSNHALAVCQRHQRTAALLFIDLDEFKLINDGIGHAEGDRVLRDMGRLLLSSFRNSDIVGRIGGDEFSVFLSGTAAEDSQPCLERLRSAVIERNSRSPKNARLQYSVGVVGFDPARHGRIEDLLSEADASMYRNKNAKRKQRATA